MVFREGQWKSFACSLLVAVAVIIAGSYETSAAIGICPTPRCVTYEELNTLWVDPSPAFFQQCRPLPNGTWAPLQMPCPPGTLFSFREQVCVPQDRWNATTNCTGTDPVKPACGDPRCETYDEINTRWVHRQPGMFYHCRPAPNLTWVPQEMACGPGTLFSFYHQTCVRESMWNGTCTKL